MVLGRNPMETPDLTGLQIGKGSESVRDVFKVGIIEYWASKGVSIGIGDDPEMLEMAHTRGKDPQNGDKILIVVCWAC